MSSIIRYIIDLCTFGEYIRYSHRQSEWNTRVPEKRCSQIFFVSLCIGYMNANWNYCTTKKIKNDFSLFFISPERKIF